MIPNLSLSQSAKSDAGGGSQGVTNNVLHQGDWNITNAPNSTTGSNHAMNTKTMMYVGLAVVALWYFKKHKSA